MTMPAHFLDLNPIENAWNRMEDLIWDKYPDLPSGKARLYDELHKIPKETWGFVRLEELVKLIANMSRRYHIVNDTHSRDTKY